MSNQQAKVAITLDDGSVAIMSFLTRGRGNMLPNGARWSDTPGYWEREPSDENLFSEISRTFHSGPQPVSYRLVMAGDMPADRTYRNAWVDNGSAIVHDMPKARDLHLAKLRRMRDVRLGALDNAWMRATGQRDNAEANRIEAERQALRDMPERVAPLLAAAQDIEQLKLVT